MVLGIDLGTTYSAAAYVKQNGDVDIVSNSEGTRQMPSVVMFDDDNGIIVGEVAKDNEVLYPEKVVVAAKNEMGKKKVLKTYKGVDYFPEMISSFIIRKIVQDAEDYTGENIQDVVITVPAYFNDAQRKATENAAEMANVHLVGMINEPTAAALCYIHNHDIKDQNLLIYDLGGGTFDVTVLHVTDSNHIETVSTGGLSNTGGLFFDEMISDYVCDQVDEDYGIDLNDDEYEDELQDLFVKAEKAKIELSQKEKTIISMKVDKNRISVEITRDWLERDDILGRIYLRTESKIKDVLRQANLKQDDIDCVLLVGGSSRIPYIGKRVGDFIGKKPSKEINPSEAVAVGAALYYQFKAKGDKSAFSDVCSHSYGVVAYEHDQEVNSIMIPRNSHLPIRKERSFRTACPNQKLLEMQVTEGEYKEISDVQIFGEFTVDFPPNVPYKSKIVVSLGLNDNSLINVRVSLPELNFMKECDLKRRANMDDETLKNMTGMLVDMAVN